MLQGGVIDYSWLNAGASIKYKLWEAKQECMPLCSGHKDHHWKLMEVAFEGHSGNISRSGEKEPRRSRSSVDVHEG